KKGSIVSEASYTGDLQKTLTEVLSYCQAMYDAIQKLDKKFDLLHRKVSEMQHTRVKPLLLKPVSIKDLKSYFSFNSGHVQVNSVKRVQQSLLQFESQQPVLRQSPPLPTIVSTHSLHSPCAAPNCIPDLPALSNIATTVVESTVNTADSPGTSSVMAPSSETMTFFFSLIAFVFIKEYVGDPLRNVKVLGNYLMKARQKTKPKYAARYLVRVLFPKETLLYSIMGVSARGRRTLDHNKIAAIREFLAANFPNYDLSEYGKDWKTCITNVNAMIRCLRSEKKISTVKHVLNSFMFQETPEGKTKLAETPDTSFCMDLNCSEDGEGNSQNSQKIATTDRLQNSGWDKLPEALELLGSPWRNVQLPFSVIYVAKGKSRPELSARYLIRHLFTEDVLVKSNVYGNLERGMSPLDCNRINALRDFLQENYPSFDLKETGYDWKACVAAINSTIRSLRHDLKKATIGM
ncbi:BEND2 protein, partial [Crypturellus soui]|nr:BEND2 protein [Crypturellus soui]